MNERIGIYCCLKKYSEEVWNEGLHRNSNAFFSVILPEISLENLELENTLAVSIFHGISAQVWEKLFFYNGNLRKCMRDLTGDTSVTMFIFPVEKQNDKEKKQYFIRNKKSYLVTYPYYKIIDIGAIAIDKQKSIKINIEITEKISCGNMAIVYPRFFYRPEAKQQNIKGIHTKEILRYCRNCAKKILPNIMEIRKDRR